ncbi:MAG: hypothetical protein GC155_11920 [Alphaproteobacteria bacterium]|nr:hypothetical protein [Alphaproteobacteria bacterium]
MNFVRTITAYNSATTSENKIHDDATATKFGFSGGLVPGVDDFAYMAHAPVKLWGREWLSQGAMRARFLKPVYDGDEATLNAGLGETGKLTLSLSSRNIVCAEGEARREAAAGEVVIPPAAQQPAPESRPPASPASLVPGQVLGYAPEPYTAERGREHLGWVSEDTTLYDDGAIASPAYMLRRANYILAANVRLGPWIHTESDIRLHNLLHDGETLEARARVADNFETKGHRIVSLDFAILASGRLAMSGRHWAIYEPRQVRGG